MTNESSLTGAISRRTVLTGVAAVGVTSALAACGSDSTGTSSGSGSASLAKADVPVGGGKIVNDQQIVVTQPSAGTFKAFSAVCTHQGCLVGSVDKSKIVCPCHNSTFSALDGSVISGPAVRSLEAKTVTVSGDNLTIS